MGFYSIYKIIKDMFRTLFGNKSLKIFIIICIFLTLFFILQKNSVFAVSPTVLTYNQETHVITYNNTDYKINDNIFTMPYLLIFEDTQAYFIRVIASSQPFFMGNPYSGSYTIKNFVATDFYWQDIGYRYNGLSTVVTSTLSNYQHGYYSSGIPGISSNFISQENILFLNFDIYDFNNQSNLLFSSNAIPQFEAPTLGNAQSDLENLNFSNFIINANDYTEEIENNDGTLFMLFYNKSLDKTTVDYLYPIKEKGFTKGSIYTDYENSTSDNMVFSFPIFMSGVFFNVDSTYQIRFAKQNYNSEYNIMTYEYLGEPYTFTISSNVTQDYINQLNQQTATSTDSESTQELQTSINQQTQSINDINNSINDSTVDNSSINLPTDNTQDITQSGVDNIFQTIYNSFTSGTPQDIILPIPFSDNNITIKPSYLYDNLQNIQWRKLDNKLYSSLLLVYNK